jgi:hypothetical protein
LYHTDVVCQSLGAVERMLPLCVDQ